jgi:Fur family ferric uptake transcriptional regulator
MGVAAGPTPGSSTSTSLLQAAGLRVTPQRRLVIEVLAHAAGQHLTAEDVWTAVRDRYDGFNRSTVYRVLEQLADAHVVTMHRLGGSVAQFELAGVAPHHHLVCVRCRRVAELLDGDLRALRRRVLARERFTVGPVSVTIEGICARCQDAAG